MNNVDAAMEYLVSVQESIQNIPLKNAVWDMLHELPSFKKGYGSKLGTEHSHHAYQGGLVVHTAEVVEIALEIASSRNLSLNKDILIAAAILHDTMKVRDYSSTGESTMYRDLVRHVAGSYAYWEQLALQNSVDEYLTIRVSHCILAHHGRQEWGSPIEPQTIEADILHYADMLSQRYGRGRELPVVEENTAVRGVVVSTK